MNLRTRLPPFQTKQIFYNAQAQQALPKDSVTAPASSEPTTKSEAPFHSETRASDISSKATATKVQTKTKAVSSAVSSSRQSKQETAVTQPSKQEDSVQSSKVSKASESTATTSSSAPITSEHSNSTQVQQLTTPSTNSESSNSSKSASTATNEAEKRGALDITILTFRHKLGFQYDILFLKFPTYPLFSVPDSVHMPLYL